MIHYACHKNCLQNPWPSISWFLSFKNQGGKWKDCSNLTDNSHINIAVSDQSIQLQHIGVSKNSGTPKWMVYNGNPIKMDDLGVPLFLETSTSFPPPPDFSTSHCSKSPRKWGTTSRCYGSPTRQRSDSLGLSANSWPPQFHWLKNSDAVKKWQINSLISNFLDLFIPSKD